MKELKLKNSSEYLKVITSYKTANPKLYAEIIQELSRKEVEKPIPARTEPERRAYPLNLEQEEYKEVKSKVKTKSGFDTANILTIVSVFGLASVIIALIVLFFILPR